MTKASRDKTKDDKKITPNKPKTKKNAQQTKSHKTSSHSKPKKRQQKKIIDRHKVRATKSEAETLKSQIQQYMDTSGYVSWSAKKRKYAIFGANSAGDGLVPCPSCGMGQLHVIKSSKSGKRFIGCTNFYGGCDASSPLLQKARLRATKKACSVCKWPEVIFRYSSKQKWTRQCSNIACSTRSNT